MGSFDPEPADWNDFADIAWNPPHAIYCDSKWSGIGAERHAHQVVAEVRSCYQAAHDEARDIEVWPCGWILEGRYGDGSRFSYPCTAPARLTPDRGEGCYACDNGHDFIPPQIRQAEGWDYAADLDEARGLRTYGIMPVGMDGGSI